MLEGRSSKLAKVMLRCNMTESLAHRKKRRHKRMKKVQIKMMLQMEMNKAQTKNIHVRSLRKPERKSTRKLCLRKTTMIFLA